MFNRSKKYIILLIINIIILVFAYISLTQKPKDPFDTNYVISLLENETKLKSTIRELEKNLLSLNKREDDLRIQLEQTKLLISASEQKFKTCEAEKARIIADAKLAANNRNDSNDADKCATMSVDLSVISNKSELLEQQLNAAKTELSDTQETLIRLKQTSTQAQEKSQSELEFLRLYVLELEQALKEPIAIQKHYLTAMYCPKPIFAELICIEEFLVRPTFSKLPATKVAIEIVNPNDKTVAKGEFNSGKSQLFRLRLERQTELPKGQYHVVYRVDNQTLRSEFVVLSQ